MPRWFPTLGRGQVKRQPAFLVVFGLALVYGFSDPSAALAQTCTTSGSIITCAAGGTFISTGANAGSQWCHPSCWRRTTNS